MTMNRLRQRYQQDIAPKLKGEFKYSNVHQIPALVKVVVSAGVGRATGDTKHLDQVMETLARITGQQPIRTTAKKSVAAFKVRQGQKIGATVTLRGERMYDFLDRLISVTLPRVRDFRGVSEAAFDATGNYSLGLPEHVIFPEISYEEVANTHGLQINIITTASSAAEGKRLLELLGMPLRRND